MTRPVPSLQDLWNCTRVQKELILPGVLQCNLPHSVPCSPLPPSPALGAISRQKWKMSDPKIKTLLQLPSSSSWHAGLKIHATISSVRNSAHQTVTLAFLELFLSAANVARWKPCILYTNSAPVCLSFHPPPCFVRGKYRNKIDRNAQPKPSPVSGAFFFAVPNLLCCASQSTPSRPVPRGLCAGPPRRLPLTAATPSRRTISLCTPRAPPRALGQVLALRLWQL